MFILFDSILTGINIETERNLIWYETGSAMIMKEQLWEERENLPLQYVIEEPAPLLEELDSMGIAAAPRTSFSAEIVVYKDPFPEQGSIRVQVSAIDPNKDQDVFRLKETMVDGRFLEPEENGVLLGGWMAEDLGAKVGYPITLVTRTRYGVYQTIDLEVVGILNTPNPVINRSMAYIPIALGDYYLQMEGAVTELALHFPFTEDPDKKAASIASDLQAKDRGLTVVSWRDLAHDFVEISSAKEMGTNLIMFLVFVIAAVGISNTMLMAVYERIREVGMMRAMGMSDAHIRLSFLFEAAGIGVIGGIIGVCLGVLVNIPMINIGIDYSSLLRDMDIGYRITGIMRGIWRPEMIVAAFFIAIIIAVVVAMIPTRKALKMQITDCLHYQ
jgi:ABC-type lipoprotein release transport system permease subunit